MWRVFVEVIDGWKSSSITPMTTSMFLVIISNDFAGEENISPTADIQSKCKCELVPCSADLVFAEQ